MSGYYLEPLYNTQNHVIVKGLVGLHAFTVYYSNNWQDR